MKIGHIPSARQLKLKRFERPDFRSTTKRGKRAQGWTWSRVLYRLRRFNQQWDAVLDRDIVEPFRRFVRAIVALKTSRPARRPDVSRETLLAVREHTTKEWAAVVRQVQRASMHEPHPARGIVQTGAARQSTPERLSARRPGAHRLDRLTTLPHQAYLIAMDARAQYVTANLLRLKGLAARRAFGEPSWRESVRVDNERYAAA